MTKNPLLQTLIAMTGQDNVITVHRPFVRFTGTLEAAMMLSQLLYWTPKATIPGGWIAKSDKDWRKELCLTRYGHRGATQKLSDMGIIETQLKKFNAAPTIHYRVRWETLENLWTEWIRSSENERTENLESDEPSSENERTLTETTPETTAKKKPAAKPKIEVPAEVKLFREVTERYPNKINYPDVTMTIQEVSKRLGRECTAEDLRPFYAAWCAKGFKPVNLSWLGWAQSGVIPQPQRPQISTPKGFEAGRLFLEKHGGQNG